MPMKSLRCLALILAALLAIGSGADAQTGRRILLMGAGGAKTCATVNSACDASAVTLFAAMTTPPTAARRTLINNTIVSLKAAGIWQKCDCFYNLIAANSQAAGLNWVNPATFTLTPTTTPAFNVDYGYTGNGTSSYLETGWNPSTNGVNYTLNSATLFVWSFDNIHTDNAAMIGINNANTTNAALNPANGSVATVSTSVNSTQINAGTYGTSSGLFVLDRTASNAYTTDQNSVQLAANATASGSLANATFRILAAGGSIPQFTARTGAFAGMCASLNSTQRVQLYTILQAYIAGIGANVKNFNAPSYGNTAPTASQSQISHYDTTGNKVDAHAGTIIQVGGTFYLYGEHHGCGMLPGTSGFPWCGIGVYVSTDLVNWTFRGLLFDPSTWQTACQSVSGTFNSCYGPKITFNAANNNYVVWLYGQNASVNVEHVFTCTLPDGGATPSTPGTNCVQQPDVTITSTAGEPGFCVDASGNGYMVYNELASGQSYHVKAVGLIASYTNFTGTPLDTGGIGEGIGCFWRASKMYVVYGSMNCGYCTSATVSWIASTTPLTGGYSGAAQINGNSCQGQPNINVFPLTLGAYTDYMVYTDEWWGPPGTTQGTLPNQGMANFYAGYLQFDASGNLLNFSCNPVVMVPGLGPAAAPVAPSGPYNQSDYGDLFADSCDITSTTPRMQTFVPTISTVTSISLPVMQNNQSCTVGTTCATPTPNGTLTVSLVTVDGSNNPVSTLATATLAVSAMKWAGTWTVFNMGGATVTPGGTFAYTLTSTGTVGCVGTAISATNGVNPYPTGVERVSANSGTSYTTETGRAMMFATK